MEANKLRIKLRAYDFNVLDASVQEIVQTAKNTGARVAGPIPLPTEVNRYTVLRSPHVNKKSREQFEMSTLFPFFPFLLTISAFDNEIRRLIDHEKICPQNSIFLKSSLQATCLACSGRQRATRA